MSKITGVIKKNALKNYPDKQGERLNHGILRTGYEHGATETLSGTYWHHNDFSKFLFNKGFRITSSLEIDIMNWMKENILITELNK